MAAVLALVVLPVVSLVGVSPAGAAPQPFSLGLVPGQGLVFLGDNPEPLSIGDPTTISGTIDDVTGAVSGASFSTPDIPFSQESGGLNVDIVAKFSELTPGANTGQADGLGNVRVNLGLRLDLAINVGGGAILTDCISSPINLSLRSTAPYDPVTKRVSLEDAGFTIPAVVASDACNSLVVGPINEQLAGSNNTMRFVMEGDLALPPPPGDPSATTLVSAAPSTPMGQPATFTATVDPDDATGTITFRNGPVTLGQVPLVDASATLVTTALPVGTHQITAEYSGDTDYERSTSTPLTYTVTAVPGIAADFPTHIVAGADPVTFTATVSNPASGAALSNLRVDWRFGRVGGDGLGTNFSNARFQLAYQDGADWVDIPLARRTTPAPADDTGTLAGAYGGLTGFALAPGQEREVTFRITTADNVAKGPMPVQVRLNTVDADTGEVVTTLSEQLVTSALIGAERYPVDVYIDRAPAPVFRQGYMTDLLVRSTRSAPAPVPNMTGQVELYIDGQHVMVAGDDLEPVPSLPISADGIRQIAFFPETTRNLAPGAHTVSVRYLGDPVYLPDWTEEVNFTILPLAAPAYDCYLDIVIVKAPMVGRMDLGADLPAAALPGTTVRAGRPVLQAIVDGSQFPIGAVSGMIEDSVSTIELTNGGTGTFETIGGFVHANTIDQTVNFLGAEIELPIEGQPGDVLDFDLSHIDISFPFALAPGANASFGCDPADGDVLARLGSVVVAGTTVEAAPGLVEEGAPLTLTANVFPVSAQGVVEFRAGSTSLGFAPVAGGQANLTVRDLPVGSHAVTARYTGDLQTPASMSESTEVVVRDAIDCPAHAVPGSGAVVRLVYLDLLGRCPDAAGFTYWTGRLDAGQSAESFARAIAYTPEAVGVVVDDGYRTMLGRPADAAGKAFWTNRLLAHGRYDTLLADLASSPEFWSQSGSTNAGFVTRVYDRLLGRAPDAAGLAYWTARLEAGTPRGALVRSLANLDEPLGRMVTLSYGAILDRSPDGTERGAGISHLRATGDRSGLYAQLIGTAEFATRAQGFPNRGA